MNSKRIVLVAVITGLLGVLLISIWVSGMEERIRKDYEGSGMNSAVAALADIAEGTVIKESMTGMKKISSGEAREALFGSSKEIAGKTAAADIKKGSFITAFMIEGEGGSLAGKIPAIGLRAFSIPVSGVNALSGMLKPGNRVDIIGTFRDVRVGGYAEPSSYTILQNVCVLALGNSSEGGTYNSVTVSVTPDEAEILSLAVNSGTVITLSLRKTGDDEIVELSRKRYGDIFNMKASLNEKRKQLGKPVEVIRRAEKNVENIR